MNAAQAIQEHLSARLQSRDERATYRAVAALVDEHPSAWARWVRGEVVPSADRVHAWCMRAHVAIYTVGHGWECDEPSPWDKRPSPSEVGRTP